MREIKFRGKAIWSLDKLNELNIDHVNGWVYGNLVMYDDIPFIVALSLVADAYNYWIKVHPESVGQYTGLKDENEREIYEGDIVKHAIWGDVYEVIFEDGGFYVLSSYDFQTINEYPLEVVGNVFENPELLEGKREMNDICRNCNGSGGIDIFDDSIGEVVTITCSDCGGSGVSDD